MNGKGDRVHHTFNITVLIAAIYKYLPDAVIHWRDVWVGAAVTSFLFIAGKYLIGVYLGQTATGSAFGAGGSFAVLLIWIYYSALISFFGAEFTQIYARRHGRKIVAEAHTGVRARSPIPNDGGETRGTTGQCISIICTHSI